MDDNGVRFNEAHWEQWGSMIDDWQSKETSGATGKACRYQNGQTTEVEIRQ